MLQLQAAFVNHALGEVLGNIYLDSGLQLNCTRMSKVGNKTRVLGRKEKIGPLAPLLNYFLLAVDNANHHDNKRQET